MSIYLGKRYEVLTKIGAGGMADVYKGKDHMLNRYVAIKVLKKEFREDETFVKKFRSEAQAAAGLLNPNIVNVYDVGEDRGLYYMVMELVDGITLKEYIDIIGQNANKNVTIGYGDIPYGPLQVMYLCADITALREDTGFEPRYSFEDGIKETIEWCRTQNL